MLLVASEQRRPIAFSTPVAPRLVCLVLRGVCFLKGFCACYNAMTTVRHRWHDCGGSSSRTSFYELSHYNAIEPHAVRKRKPRAVPRVTEKVTEIHVHVGLDPNDPDMVTPD